MMTRVGASNKRRRMAFRGRIGNRESRTSRLVQRQPGARSQPKFPKISPRQRARYDIYSMYPEISKILGLLVAAGLSACSSGPRAAQLQQAVNDFNTQQYAQAHSAASELAERGRPGQREAASYVAGLSAYQLGDLEGAQRHLMNASGSSDPRVAACAKAMLGQLRLDQQRPVEAAALLRQAAEALVGEDARKAAYYAGIAFRLAGDKASAATWLGIAENQSSFNISAGSPLLASPQAGASAASVRAASMPLEAPGFTLQVGAFKEKRRAQRAANEVQKLAERDGLGDVRIVPRRDDRGRSIYMVQFGTFPTRDA